jgi:hypothetical protein
MTTVTEHLNNLVEGLASDVRDEVAEIETSTPTTRNHYGRYMAILCMFKEVRTQKLLVLALIRAGANEQGVIDAARVLGLSD